MNSDHFWIWSDSAVNHRRPPVNHRRPAVNHRKNIFSPSEKKIKFFLFIFSPDHGILSTKKVVPKKKNFPPNRNYFSTFFSVHTSELGFRWIIWSLKKKCWGEVIFFWIFGFQIWPKSWDLEPWEGFIWPLKSKKRRNFFAPAVAGREGGSRPLEPPASSRS